MVTARYSFPPAKYATRSAIACSLTVASSPSGISERLVLASDLYIFARDLTGIEDGRSVIAGYPWFGDWGRDTMICLTGLALATGRPEWARRR